MKLIRHFRPYSFHVLARQALTTIFLLIFIATVQGCGGKKGGVTSSTSSTSSSTTSSSSSSSSTSSSSSSSSGTVNVKDLSQVNGRILDIYGQSIEGAGIAVYSGGSASSSSAVSSVDGSFSLKLEAAKDFVLRVSVAGFADQVVPVKSPDTDGEITIEASLIARAAPITISDTGTLTHTGTAGAKVTVDKADFVDVAGNPVAGNIDLTITPVDVSNPAAVAAFPGSFAGIVEGQSEPTPIVSLGVVEYEFTSNGQPVNLAADTSAEIIVPIYVTTYPDGSAIKLGDSIPFWSLNESTSIWQQEGEGVVVSSNDSPTGLAFKATVTHFSWWNCDVTVSPAKVEITVLGVSTGDATILANAPGLVNWRGENASTTVSVGGTTKPLFIPSGIEVCFAAAIFYDAGGFVTTEQECLTADAGASVSVTLFDPAMPLTDSDGDGVFDIVDNCRAVPNPRQLDSDNDGFGNMCDADYDNDGKVDSADFSRFQALFDVQDPGADLNGDGQVNLADLNAFQALFGIAPGPGAGVDDMPTSSVNGRITDIAGITVSNATVTVYQDGAIVQQAAPADILGEFDLTLPAAKSFSLLVSSPNFADQVVPVKSPDADGQISISATLIARAAPITISDNGLLTHSGKAGAKVTVDKADFVDAAGNPVMGDIELTITPVDVSNPAAVAAFPGSFSGVPEGETNATPIVSLGVVEYEFTSNGQPVNLAPNTSAEIIVPIYVKTYPDGSAIKLGDAIPLWSLNESTSIWQQEGEGIVIASNESPTGLAFKATATHFSWWNCDVAPQTAKVEVTVLGEDAGDAIIFANAPELINWRGENASTTINVGETTEPLFIPAGIEVCFSAGITYDKGGFALTAQICLSANAGEIIPITLFAATEGPLKISTNPRSEENNTVSIQALTALPIRPVTIFPLTVETSVNYTVTVGRMPAGLSLDAFDNQARIVGEPTEVGNFSFTVTATDGDGYKDEVIFNYEIQKIGDAEEIILSFSESSFVINLFIDLHYGTALIDWNDGSPIEVIDADSPSTPYRCSNSNAAYSRLSHTYDASAGSVKIIFTKGLASARLLGTSASQNSGGGFNYNLSAIQGLSGLQVFFNHGYVESITGDISALPNDLRCVSVEKNNFTGDIGALPQKLTALQLLGLNTVSGDIATLPRSLTELSLKGNNTVTGNIAALPLGLEDLRLQGANTVTGDIATLPQGNQFTFLELQGDNTVTGDISMLPKNLKQVYIGGNNTVYGDLGMLNNTGLSIFSIAGSNSVNDVSITPNWRPFGLTRLILGGSTGGLDADEVDRLLKLISQNTGRTNGIIRVNRPKDSAPTAASSGAIVSLKERLFTISTN